MSVGPGSHLAELLLINGHEVVLQWMKKVASTDNYQNPRFTIVEDPMEGKAISYWTEEDGKDVTPSLEKKKPTVEELAKAVEKSSINSTNGSPEKGHNAKGPAAAMKTETAQMEADNSPRDEVSAETPNKEDNNAQAAAPKAEITCIEEVPAVPVIPEDPTEKEARLKKEDEEAETAKQARLKVKKEEEEASNLEHMRRTVLHALDGVEGLLGSVFNRGNSRISADGDEEADEE
jgi:hypothetical protein